MRAAWLRIGGVALLALAVAVGVGAAVSRLRPDLARPADGPFAPLPFDRIDVEERLESPVVDHALRLARSQGIDRLVSLTGGFFGNGLETQLAAAARHVGQVKVFMNLDPRGCCGEDWSAREAARVASGRAAGAAGLFLDAGGPVALDAPPLERVLEECLRLRLPVAVKVAGPADVAALSRAAGRRPGLALLALGLDLPPAEVQALLARHPALHVSVGVRLAAWARDPAGARAAVLAHPDRFLFGTSVALGLSGKDEVEVRNVGRDAAQVRDFYSAQYRFFESRDPHIPVPEGTAAGGLGLPRAALHRLYHRNAERLLGFAAERG
ncbi:MAG: amidohydrolase family protein [Deltaproteobacteria bacterium]|nr:amidohydrolase family protein [Deltaproteobacteria bacterium]